MSQLSIPGLSNYLTLPYDSVMNASVFNHSYTGPSYMSLHICPGISVGVIPKVEQSQRACSFTILVYAFYKCCIN